jgi:hypothetical protein
MAYYVVCPSDDTYTPWYCGSLAYAKTLKSRIEDAIRERFAVVVKIDDEGQSSVKILCDNRKLAIVPAV